MSEAYIVDGIRTAIGSFGGTLSTVRPDDLAAFVIKRLLERQAGLDASKIDDVIFGSANQAGEDNRNVARMALLLAGVPESVPGETVNRLCASGLCAAINASRAIKSKEGDLIIAGGVESMTRAPFVLSKSSAAFARNVELFDSSIGWRFVNPKMKERYGTDSMGETAENVAELLKISRQDQDEFALNSQQKAARAREAKRFAQEIAALEVMAGKGKTALFEHDEFIRPDSSAEALSKLKPAFKASGSVTAGNSSGINDGACALLIASDNALKSHNLKPKARIVASGASGIAPRIMGLGPIEAAKIALKRAGIKLSDLSVIELNEAFAAQSLGCIRELGLTDQDPRINPNGGAIALGHPLGMSGARLLLTATHELHKNGGKFALCTMCVGVGQGVACVIEKL